MNKISGSATQREDHVSQYSPIRQVSGKTRLRTRRACEPCRKRKRKCDGLYPCDQCTGYEYCCQYSSQSTDAAANPSHRIPSEGFKGPGSSKANKADREQMSGTEIGHPSASPPLTRLTQGSSPGTSPNSKVGRAVVEPRKGRFSYAHSGVVLPRKLGQEMNLRDDLKFHSYGWNLSTRPESQTSVAPTVRRYLTFQDLSFYGQLYFDIVDPVYHFVDRTRFYDRCANYWLAEKLELDDIEALISGVVALGSFFAVEPSPAESQLVEHAKQILDIGCAYAPARLSMDQAAAWVLRTLYLRLTTRPHLSWYASCAAVHVVEAMGLHVDLEGVDLAGDDSTALTADFISSRRCIFECATFLNAIISAEYGRSRIPLPGPELSSESDDEINSSTTLGKLTKILILIEMDPAPGKRRDILSSICGLPDEPPIFVLLKTDVAIHMYRKQVNVKHENPSSLEIQAMLSIINAALSAVRHLLSSKQPWWNLISTPFQSAMILMAMDSNGSLDLLSECMSVLTAIYETFKTHSVLEVIQTAKCLTEGLERRKLQQAGFLRKAAELSSVLRDSSTTTQGPLIADQAQIIFDGWMGGETDWNFMFEGDALGNSSLGIMSNFP